GLFVYPDSERTDGHRSIQTTLLFLLSSTTSRRQHQRPRRRPQFNQIQNPPVLTAVLDSLSVARRGCSVLNSIPHSCPVLLTRRTAGDPSASPCAALGQEWLDAGEMVHGFVIRSGFDANIPLANALIAMYGKCGSIPMAEALFEGMAVRSLVSWNTMVAIYEQHGDVVEAIKFFHRMLTEKVGFDCVTLVSVLSACGRSGALETGKWVHEFARSHGLDADARIGNVLVDMYAKCGEIADARKVFDCLHVRGVVSWSAMISAYANHGDSEEALKLFCLMKSEGVRPNSFTFTAVLVACGHSGLVNEGLKHFNSILSDYQMSPTLEHYACIVDMLGRAGRLVEAYEIIRGMSLCPDKCVWGAFLGGCKLHSNLELAEFVAKDLFQSGSNDVTFYVLMSNMYFEAGMLEDAERIRRAMKEMELKKTAGHSAVNQ
ncbi:hypothetical protein SORBI_3005G081000, partial [Sorghum bicolor]